MGADCNAYEAWIAVRKLTKLFATVFLFANDSLFAKGFFAQEGL